MTRRTSDQVGRGAFREWMREVDEACWRRAGVSIHDLPDQCFRDAFEMGERPSAFIEGVLEDEGLIADAPYDWSDEATGLNQERAAERQFELDGGA